MNRAEEIFGNFCIRTSSYGQHMHARYQLAQLGATSLLSTNNRMARAMDSADALSIFDSRTVRKRANYK